MFQISKVLHILIISVIADCGGLLSLFLGFSFTALIGLTSRIYYFIKNNKSNKIQVFNRRVHFENDLESNFRTSRSLKLEGVHGRDLIQLMKWQNAIQNKTTSN